MGDRTLGYHETLNFRRIEAADGDSRVEMVVGPEHLRTLGICHGGALASMLDTALGLAGSSTMPPDHWAVTVQLNVNFVRPAWEGETLIATGETQHSGRSTAVVRGEIRNQADKLVATASATLYFQPHTDATRGGIERRPK